MAYDSGSYSTSPGLTDGGLKAIFRWSIEENSINRERGTATVNWSLKITGGTSSVMASLVTNGSNYLNVAGSRVWTGGAGSTGGYQNYYGSENYYDHNDVYNVKPMGYKYVYRDLASSSFTVTYDSNGNGSFNISASISCFRSDLYSTMNHTFTLRRIDRYKKGWKTTNVGSKWNKNIYFHKTINSGSNWEKCNCWKTTDSGAHWYKIS